MNIWGMIFLVVSWGMIIGITVYCFYRVLTSREEDI